MKALVTGGAGFVGTNLADYLTSKGHDVIILDNLSRKGVEKNLEWLRSQHPQIRFIKHDIRQPLDEHAKGCDVIFHTAAQVAVTTSLENPREDFEINAAGTLNVLEACRKNDCAIVLCSTNKVYGDLKHIPIIEKSMRYDYEKINGIDETAPLDPHTPYGNSKCTADIYVRDYSRMYGLPTVVFRMSCIYGAMQHGIVDQGWIDFILRTIVRGNTVTIFGDGKQVRDILHVSDLVRAFEIAYEKINSIRGNVFNIGGSKENSVSILELLEFVKRFGLKPKYTFDEWRRSDQKIFYCDISKAKSELGWEPRVGKEEGLKKQYEWVLKSEGSKSNS